MTIYQLQKKVKDLMKIVNKHEKFEYPYIMSMVKIYEELGEVSELIANYTVDSRKSQKLTDKEVKEPMSEEIADVVIALIGLANDFDIDLTQSVTQRIKKHTKRWNSSLNESTLDFSRTDKGR